MSLLLQARPASEPAGANRPPSQPTVCVVVPTRNEAGNVVPLLNRLRVALAGWDAQVLFVDDSDDLTPDVVMSLIQAQGIRGADRNPAIRLLHRTSALRLAGLGGAVQAGLRATAADVVVVMDGDLQHPPEVVPTLVRALLDNNLDAVIASRYCGTGDAAGLSSAIRELASSGATLVTRALFPRVLGAVTDPMSGFFALRRAAVDPESLQPRGFKILLEVLTREPNLSVGEIPFTFCSRGTGDSKAGLREGVRLLRQLTDLRLQTWGRWVRPVEFGLVGVSGIFVNLVVLAVLLGVGLGSSMVGGEVLNAAIAAQVAIAWNYRLSKRWVFGDRPRPQRWGRISFWGLSNATLVVQLLLTPVLLPWVHNSYVAASGVAIVLLAGVRYVICDRLLFPARTEPVAALRRLRHPDDELSNSLVSLCLMPVGPIPSPPAGTTCIDLVALETDAAPPGQCPALAIPA